MKNLKGILFGILCQLLPMAILLGYSQTIMCGWPPFCESLVQCAIGLILGVVFALLLLAALVGLGWQFPLNNIWAALMRLLLVSLLVQLFGFLIWPGFLSFTIMVIMGYMAVWKLTAAALLGFIVTLWFLVLHRRSRLALLAAHLDESHH